jgi:hypothetical protein
MSPCPILWSCLFCPAVCFLFSPCCPVCSALCLLFFYSDPICSALYLLFCPLVLSVVYTVYSSLLPPIVSSAQTSHFVNCSGTSCPNPWRNFCVISSEREQQVPLPPPPPSSPYPRWFLSWWRTLPPEVTRLSLQPRATLLHS